MKTLIVIDMQNDFINGPLGTPEARAIVPKVKDKINEYRKSGGLIVFTRDTHRKDYLETNEGKHLPVEHCIAMTSGWKIIDGLSLRSDLFVNKRTFGYTGWEDFLYDSTEIELVGVCTDICVVSNALIVKASFPEINITVDASCCAGTTPENHKAALQVMKSCQINVINEV